MKNLLVVVIAACCFAGTACNKAPGITTPAEDFPTLEQKVLTDFTNNIAIAGYLKLSIGAANLNTAIQNLYVNTNEANLAAARQSWKDMRLQWEQCEGFLFGPVEDNDYDPNMDTWPTDYTQLDSVIASTNTLQVSDIQNFTLSLRGFHPIEYILFGVNGSRAAADITPRQKLYMISLTSDLISTCNDLYLSWVSAPVNFGNEVITAGKGSTKFTKRQEVFLALTGALTDICGEVGDSKMKEPFDAINPQIVESPYSGNSLIDFKNNITGLQNVYLGLNGGKGLKDLVAAKNKALDNKIQSQITSAINSFSNITEVYEKAIISQRVQVQQTMTTLNSLAETLENELKPFIVQYVVD